MNFLLALFFSPFPPLCRRIPLRVEPAWGIAGHYGTWTVTWEVGPGGLRAGGALRVQLPDTWHAGLRNSRQPAAGHRPRGRPLRLGRGVAGRGGVDHRGRVRVSQLPREGVARRARRADGALRPRGAGHRGGGRAGGRRRDPGGLRRHPGRQPGHARGHRLYAARADSRRRRPRRRRDLRARLPRRRPHRAQRPRRRPAAERPRDPRRRRARRPATSPRWTSTRTPSPGSGKRWP